MSVKVLLMAGSNRTGSFNMQLVQAANKVLADNGALTTVVSLADYPLPIIDQDLHAANGDPANAVKLAKQMAAHDALFVASPEYNSSIPPLLKNAIDWLSVLKADVKPYAGLTVALGAASNGNLGGIRGLYHLRSVLMNVGAQIITEQIAVSGAASAFGNDGLPTNERTLSMLQTTCKSLMAHATPGRGRG